MLPAGDTSPDSFANDRAEIVARSDASQYPASATDPMQQAMQLSGLSGLRMASLCGTHICASGRAWTIR
jgi:hypothetical protein